MNPDQTVVILDLVLVFGALYLLWLCGR